jgi:hypothetical protein
MRRLMTAEVRTGANQCPAARNSFSLKTISQAQWLAVMTKDNNVNKFLRYIIAQRRQYTWQPANTSRTKSQRHRNNPRWHKLAPSLKAMHCESKNHAQERELRDANASCSRKRGANSGNLQTRQEHNSKRVQRHNNNTPWHNVVPYLKDKYHGSKSHA